MVNVHPGVRDELYKVASVNMCPNTTGQVLRAVFFVPSSHQSLRAGFTLLLET